VRTHPQWLRAREAIRSGQIGELRAVSMLFSYFNRDPADIRNLAENGGGGLLDIGCYAITLSRFAFGEEPVRAALRNVPPGDYVIPHAGSMAGMKSPEFIEKMTKGPVVIMTVRPSGPPTMGKSLVQWFLYGVLVSVFAGYVAGRALGPGAAYLDVFRFAGTTAFAGYGLAQLQGSIWWGRKWSATLKGVFDALVYALLTAGVFGWRWPAM